MQMDKLIYGYKEAAHFWNLLYIKVFTDGGYSVHRKDKCVVFKQDDTGNLLSIGALTVDDGLFASTPNEVDKVIKMCIEALGEITYEISDTIDVIGLHVELDRVNGAAKVQQKRFVSKLLADRGVSRKAPTPATAEFFDEPESPLLSNQHDFMSLNASLMYGAKRTYPEILTVVTHLARKYGKATELDMFKAQRVLYYFNNNLEEHCLYLRPLSFKVVASADASYAEHEDAKSHTGGCVGFEGNNGNGSYFLFESSKQSVVSKSSTEAELVCANTIAESGEYIRQFMAEINLDDGPVTMAQDNMSTMRVSAQGTGTYKRSKHIKVRYYWLKELIDTGVLVLLYVPSKEMVADVLSKPVVGAQFYYLLRKLLGWVHMEPEGAK